MKRILLFIVLCGPFLSQGQSMWYEGGKGDGNAHVAQTNFALALLSSQTPYVGGKADGYARSAQSSFAPSLIANQTPYVGGKADGHAQQGIINFAPILIPNFYPYVGGIADGHAMDNTSSFSPALVNNFYPYLGGKGDGWSNALNQSYVLPLVLLSFEGAAMGDYNTLNWKTSYEENVDYFLVEKSKDGKDFASIGSVNATGNSDKEQSYDFDDREDVHGVNYYKLRMTDIDRKYKYSKVIKLINEKLDYSVVLAPNPAKDNISIRLSRALESSSQFTVLDMTGKVVLEKFISKDEAVKNIDIHALVPGQYMIYLNLANDTMSLPFIKK